MARECITVIGALILGEITPCIWVLGEYLDKTRPSITVTVARVKLSLPLFVYLIRSITRHGIEQLGYYSVCCLMAISPRNWH